MASDAQKAAVVAVAKAYRAFVSDARLTVAEAQAVAIVMLDSVPADVLARLAAERLTAEARANQPAMQTWTCPPDSGAAAGAPETGEHDG